MKNTFTLRIFQFSLCSIVFNFLFAGNFGGRQTHRTVNRRVVLSELLKRRIRRIELRIRHGSTDSGGVLVEE